MLKGHNSFSYLWKFDPNTPNGKVSEKFSSKNYKFYRECDVWLINFLATQQFRSFW